MSQCAVTLPDGHLQQLRELVLPRHGREGAAYVLFRRACATDAWTGAPAIRYLSREVVPLASQDILSSSEQHITTSNEAYVRLLQRAQQTDCMPGFVHGHPGGFAHFSERDDINESSLARLMQNRNGPKARLVSLVLARGDFIFGRVWKNPGACDAIDPIVTVGERIQLHARIEDSDRTVFHRQELAFGPALTQTLARLRVGVIGCGATGSATAMLLSRLGVRKLLLVDNDTIEASNLKALLKQVWVD